MLYACDNLTDIYYIGTEEEWNLIQKKDSVWDDHTPSYTIHNNYTPES
jgi:hypothetical protein